MSPNFIFIAPLSSISKRVRLYKIINFLHNNGISRFEHIGWERIEGENIEPYLNFEINKKIILKGGGYGSTLSKLMYIIWMFKIFFISFSFKKSDKVWALGFESAFPLILASKLKQFDIYFDDADRFSMLFKFPISLNIILRKLEILTSRNVKKHIIPVKERYNYRSDNFFLLKNTPSKTEIKKAYTIFKQKEWIKAKVIININGWLGKGRGMHTALCLYDELKNEDIGFILAGKIDCEDAEILSKQDKVQYLGKVSNAESLSSYFASDFVFTYYEPNSQINICAASNKWGDAIITGIGVIVNTEVITAKYLTDNKMSISCNYNDYKSLAMELRYCLADKQKLIKIKSNAKLLSENCLLFEDQLNILFSNEKH